MINVIIGFLLGFVVATIGLDQTIDTAKTGITKSQEAIKELVEE